MAEIGESYISGGKLSGNTCLTCNYRYPDPHNFGWGWCIAHDYASVSSTGYCVLHSVEEAEQQAAPDEAGGADGK